MHSNGDSWGTYSYHADDELDRLVEQVRTTLDVDEKDRLIRRVARLKHERVAGGLPTYRPKVTFAWRDSLEFHPEPGASWRAMRDIGPRQ